MMSLIEMFLKIVERIRMLLMVMVIERCSAMVVPGKRSVVNTVKGTEWCMSVMRPPPRDAPERSWLMIVW